MARRTNGPDDYGDESGGGTDSGGGFEPPEFSRLGDTFELLWPSFGYRAIVSHVKESRDEIYAEVAIVGQDVVRPGMADGWGFLHRSRLNMQTPLAREKLAKAIINVAGATLNWSKAIEIMCFRVIDEYRAGEPFLDLSLVVAPPVSEFVLQTLLPKGESAVMYGDGSVGKSMLAMGIGLAVCSGQPFAGKFECEQPGRLLYLDWETQKETHARRARRLAEGYGVGIEAGWIHYRRMTGALVDQVPMLREYIDRHRIKVCIIDSLAFACGEEPNEAGVAIKTMNAARSLGTTNIVVAHVTKAAAGASGKPAKATIYGSIFFQNAARYTFEVRGSQQQDLDGSKHLMIYNRKNNDGPLASPVGLVMAFAERGGPITITAGEIASDLQGGIGAGPRVLAALRNRAKTQAELRDELGITENTLRPTISRLMGTGHVRKLVGNRYGLCAIEAAGIQPGMMGGATLAPNATPAAPEGPPWADSAEEGGGLMVAEEDRCAYCPRQLSNFTADAVPVCALHADPANRPVELPVS